MKTNHSKLLWSALVAGSLLCASSSLKAQSKDKEKNKLETAALEKFLTEKYDYVKIPITKERSGHLRVSVKVNGVPGDFILDTGAGATIIEAGKKDKFNLKLAEGAAAQGAGAGGTQSLKKTTSNTLEIGGFVKNDFNIYVMNMDHVNKAMAAMKQNEADGIIGADVLGQNKAVIDYGNLILYLKK